MSKFGFVSMLSVVSLLTACGSNDTASYMIDGSSSRAFTMFRNKSYPGADWEPDLAVTSLPDCQRRHKLSPVDSGKDFKAELYADGEGLHVLHVGKAWYQIELASCKLQSMKAVPAAPGDIVGSWDEREGKLKFFPAKKQ